MELLENHFNNLSGNLIYYETTDSYEMFSNKKGINKHINYLTFKKLFEEMKDFKNPLILESGTSKNNTNSTYIFNEYVRKYGGRFWSIDINKTWVDNHRGNMCPATQIIWDDSIGFFRDWSKKNDKADIIYLDSYDFDFYKPQTSANHGISEYYTLNHVIKKNTLLLINDTPINPYWLDTRENPLYHDMCVYYKNYNILPGKGMYILNEISNADKIIHNYQVLYKFYDTPIRNVLSNNLF